MMKNLDFVADLELRQYYLQMVSFMVASYGISESEALHRVAYFAKQINDKCSREYDWQIRHRSVEYWAEGIYYKLDKKDNKTNEIKPLPVEE